MDQIIMKKNLQIDLLAQTKELMKSEIYLNAVSKKYLQGLTTEKLENYFES
jgi:hypothetical protein